MVDEEQMGLHCMGVCILKATVRKGMRNEKTFEPPVAEQGLKYCH